MGDSEGGCPLKAVMSLFSVKVSAMPLHNQGYQEGLALKKKMTCLETYSALRGSLYSATYTSVSSVSDKLTFCSAYMCENS